MSFDAGAAVGTMGLDVGGFTAGILQANALAAIFPPVVTNFLANPLLALVGVAKDAAGAIVDAFHSVSEAADNAGESAAKLGVSVEFLTGMGRAAADAGSSMEGFQDALKFINNNAADAAGGNKTTIAAFKDIGVTVTDTAGKIKPTEQLFNEVADAISHIEDPAKRTQAAMNLMGRGGSDMLAALGGGSGGLKDLADTFADLGANITTPMAEAGDKVGTLGTIMGAFFDGLKNSVATPIMQGFADNYDAIVENIIEVSDALRPKLQAIGEAVAPFIMPAIDVLKDLGLALADAIDPAFVSSVLDSAMSLFRGFADVVTGVVIPAFKLLESILRPIFDLISTVSGVIGSVLSSVGGAGADFTRANGGSAAGAPGGGGNVNIGTLSIPGIDVKDATSAIAEKVKPAIELANRSRFSAMENAAINAQTAAGL